MRYHHSEIHENRGVAPLIVLVIVAAVLAVAGGGYVIATKTDAGKKMVSKIGLAKPAADQKAGGDTAVQPDGSAAATGVDAIQIAAPAFDFSFSPVPSLDASAFNVGSPYVASAAGAFKGLSITADFTVDTKLDVELPKITADQIKPKTLAQPETAPETEQPTVQPPSGGQGGSGGSTAVNQANCAQFSSMPNASICAQVGDPNGRTLCEQCKAAGF